MSIKFELLGRERAALGASVLAGVVGLSVGLQLLGEEPMIREDVVPSEAVFRDSFTKVSKIYKELERARIEQEAVKRALERSPQNLQTQILIERLRNVEERQERIEKVILDDPAKALEIPLLRKDLDNARDANAQSLAAIKASVEQVYDINKWLLGAIAMSIVGLAISDVLGRKAK